MLLQNNLIKDLAIAIRQVPLIKLETENESILEFEEDVMLK